MQLTISRLLVSAALALTVVSSAGAQGRLGKKGQGPGDHPPGVSAGVYTTVSGRVAQLNYNREGEVDGFLLNGNALVQVPPRAALRLESVVRVGDMVEVAGLAQTSASGWQTVRAQSIQDRTSGKSISMPQPGAAAPFSGSGRIQQLNYGPDGSVNGFLLDNGTFASVPAFNASNPTSIRLGATVQFSGYARKTMSERTVVDLQSLTVNGQALALGPMGSNAPRGPAGAPPSPPPPINAPAAPLPAGRTDQPLAPPAPPPAKR